MRIYPNVDDLSAAAAEEFVHSARAAITERGRFVVALSGGSTPKRLYSMLTKAPFREYIEWSLVHVLFGDERFVPPTDEQSNERMARESLLSHVPVPPAQVYGMVRGETPAAAADAYEAKLRDLLGDNGQIDLTLLGVGPDGHTASLFPGDPAVHESSRWTVAAKAGLGVSDRITLTPPLINRSKTVMFLVAGADKKDAMQQIFHGEENLDQTPAQAVARHADHVLWLVEEAAVPEELIRRGG